MDCAEASFEQDTSSRSNAERIQRSGYLHISSQSSNGRLLEPSSSISSSSSSHARQLEEASDFISAPVQGRITVREWYYPMTTSLQGVPEGLPMDDPSVTVTGTPACELNGTCSNSSPAADARKICLLSKPAWVSSAWGYWRS